MIKAALVREIPESHSSLQHVFCRIAHIYDAMSLLISLGLIHSWRSRVAHSFSLKAGEIGLDLGTGTADFAIALLQASASGAHLIGIDLTPEMLTQGRLKLRQRGLADQIELRVGDVEHLALPDNSVDSCYSAFLIRTLPNLEQGLREMLRVVRPGGRVVCLEVSHPSNKILRALFHLYFYKCAPFFGTLLGQRLDAYQYLPQSLKNIPEAPRLKEIMEACGWKNVHFRYFTGGFVALHIGIKE